MPDVVDAPPALPERVRAILLAHRVTVTEDFVWIAYSEELVLALVACLRAPEA